MGNSSCTDENTNDSFDEEYNELEDDGSNGDDEAISSQLNLRTVGMPPGALVGAEDMPLSINIYRYNEDSFEEYEATDTWDLPIATKGKVTWVMVRGLSSAQGIEKIGRFYKLHPLVMEDILDLSQRPKVEKEEGYIHATMKLLMHGKRKLKRHAFSMILMEGLVLTFQHTQQDFFEPVVVRLREARGELRNMGAGYLAYSLMDYIIDSYYCVLEKSAREVEKMEKKVVGNPGDEMLHEIYQLKQSVLGLRRAVWPLRDMIGGLYRNADDLFGSECQIYMRDLYDHAIQIYDMLENMREITSGLLELYLSSVNNRMNNIMKLLTLVSTIFIPLTFISGVYGMNFKDMPELSWRFGYPAVLFLMISIAGTMIYVFMRNKWL